jgi:ArsR family transcriptional regulator
VGGELTVGELQAVLGLDSSSASQHLAALRESGILESRRAGTSVYYAIRDPRVNQLLATPRQIRTSAISDSQTPLSGLAAEPPARPG